MRLIYLIFASLLLTGCLGSGLEDLEEFVQNAGEDMRGKVAPAPEVKPYEVFPYRNEKDPLKPNDPFNDKYPLPDPFKPHKSAKDSKFDPTKEDRVKEELESFPLESLKMIGFLEQKTERYAIIRAPDSRIFRVKKGSRLGVNSGQITLIADGEITIKEFVPDSEGEFTERTSTLQLDEPGAK
jgi:type IV pilus assembly protein PilP